MSPPIRDGSGNDIGAIRLGDGTEISEVRTGAGDVLFSATTSATTIPSSAVAQYDFRKEDGTLPVTDQSGNGNDLDTGSFTGVTTAINGNQVGNFAESEFIEGSFQNTSERIVVYTVFVLDDTTSDGTFNIMVNDISGPGSINIVSSFQNQWFLNQGSTSIGFAGTPSASTNFISTTIFDSTDEFRLNGSSLFTGNSGSNSLDNLALAGGDNVDGADVKIGIVEVHSGSVSGGLQTREQEIADDWGITI